MEDTFSTLGVGERDDRDCVVHGRVLTARRLGSVLFLSIDSISSFIFYPSSSTTSSSSSSSSSQPIPPSEDLENYVDKDIFIQMQGREGGEEMKFEKEEVMQVAVTKEDFNGEVRDNDDGTINIFESLKEFARTIAMGHNIGILLFILFRKKLFYNK